MFYSLHSFFKLFLLVFLHQPFVCLDVCRIRFVVMNVHVQSKLITYGYSRCRMKPKRFYGIISDGLWKEKCFTIFIFVLLFWCGFFFLFFSSFISLSNFNASTNKTKCICNYSHMVERRVAVVSVECAIKIDVRANSKCGVYCVVLRYTYGTLQR